MEKNLEMELLREVPERLLAWYDKGARVLPWREDPQPYRVWLSEIMLQQTRVEAVKPYFERFLAELPTIKDLAEAPEEQILKLWEGLGYYNRVRNLQRGAQMVMEHFGGQVPSSREALRSLPGIGDYTAGAIASIAFNIPEPAVDGNVLRVFSRILASREDILSPKTKREVEGKIRQIIPKRAGDFNQALMELGAMVCLPNGAPKCLLCPLNRLCRAHLEGTEDELPVKAEKKPRKTEDRTIFLLFCKGKAALRKRPAKGLLAGLWELPSVLGHLSREDAEGALREWGFAFENLEELSPAKHVFTHVEWHMEAWKAQVREEEGLFTWVTTQELEHAYPLPFAFKAYFPELKKGPSA